MYVIWIWRDDERRWRKHESEFPIGQSDAACTAGKELSRDFHGPVDVMRWSEREPHQVVVAQYNNGAYVATMWRYAVGRSTAY